MPFFPRIETYCPYSDRADIIAGDFCRLCQRTVTDLGAMDDAARAQFVKAAEPDACVRYRLPVGATIVTAAALAGMAMPLAAAAQDKPTAPPPVDAPAPGPAPDANSDDSPMIIQGSLYRSRTPDVTIPVIAITSEDWDRDHPPGVIDLIRRLFRRKR